MEDQNYYRKCSACKKEILFGSFYQVCSISTCRKNVYCCVTCWDVHVPVLNHKSAWAEEMKAPTKNQFLAQNTEKNPRRRIVVNSPKISSNSNSSSNFQSNSNYNKDILIVASKLKSYIKERGDMNTSGNVMDRLSDIVRRVCDDAIDVARSDGRKTVMDRDFK